jgi:hypothetical protein
MARKPRHRTPRNRRPPVKPPVTIPNDDLKVGSKIGRYHAILILLAILPGRYIGNNYNRIDAATGGLLLNWMTIIIVLGGLGAAIQIRGWSGPSIPFLTNPKKFRRYSVFLLALAIFINVMVWVPILYANGYINRLSNLLPSKQALGDKASLAIAFGLGAIISGVLGNFAYDILKYIFRKMAQGKSN